MTHAEALYAYNQYVGMTDWAKGLETALAAGAVEVGELPELLTCHKNCLDKAITAARTFKRNDLVINLFKDRRTLDIAIQVITEEVRILESMESTQ